MKMIFWLWKNYVRLYRKRLFFAMLLVVLTSVFAIMGPLIIGQLVDDVLYGENLEILMPLLIVMVALVLARMTISWCFRMLFETISQNATNNLRHDLYVKLHEMDFDYFSLIK